MKQFLLKAYSKKPNKKLIQFLESTQKELDKFFGVKIKKPFIFFVSSRKEINKLWGRKTEDWLVAWVKNNNIFYFKSRCLY